MKSERKPLSERGDRFAFTLIETVVALAIVTLGLLAALMLVPLGLKVSRISATQTVVATILEDIHGRVEGQPLEAGPLAISPIYYDEHGVFVSPLAPKDRQIRRTYRADLEIMEIDSSTAPEHAGGLKSLVIYLGWPVKGSNGNLLGSDADRRTVSYYVTTLAGDGWQRIDANYEPVIGF